MRGTLAGELSKGIESINAISLENECGLLEQCSKECELLG